MLQKLNSRLHEPAYWRGSSPSSSLEYTHIQLNKLAYFGNGNTTPTGKLKHSISITTLNHFENCSKAHLIHTHSIRILKTDPEA